MNFRRTAVKKGESERKHSLQHSETYRHVNENIFAFHARVYISNFSFKRKKGKAAQKLLCFRYLNNSKTFEWAKENEKHVCMYAYKNAFTFHCFLSSENATRLVSLR